MQIEYRKGDATAPVGAGNKIIVHVCNDIGAWGKGFVMAISKRWKKPEMEYKKWAKSREAFALGEVQFVQVEETLWIANLIGQRDIKKDKDDNPPIRYEAINKGITTVSAFAIQINATLHMPRIGCGLAGGSWDKIEPIIKEALINRGIQSTVYDFE